ncbi:DUF2264 domain-containing protein [Paenibacillus ihbetae]|uniref:DUF2264 domain-containing protein n=1 Tax=Paenibacillus ihbetae TaxID=1870820 RepID=A0ABX3JTQ1_9BACL|nr:DUF2264 domain-containing protein [Paenibacillus ihbetae]OOC58823.1 hypothetical protein BBD40_24435 [Paenibacillus ihbetae]
MSLQGNRSIDRTNWPAAGAGLHPVARNPLKSRQDMYRALGELLAPLQPYYSKGYARLSIGSTGTGYSANVAEMEGFSRVLWGLVPAIAGGSHEELWERCLDGIRAGTDPEHKEYWGDVADYDQRLVEMAVFGLALALVPDRIWHPLNEQEQSNLYQWLNQINRHPCYDCNWLFFNVLVNIGFRKAGLPYDEEQVERNLNRIDEFYLSGGWYSDGIGGHCDYYGPFAIHYYGLVYARLMAKEDPKRAERYLERAAAFASDFVYWHAPDGAAIPYGRSLTYRFAQSAFWSAAAFAGMAGFKPGELKGLVLRNLRWWFRQPIFDRGGILTIGYAYPNQIMSENYNSPGSSYWALKTFLVLALAEDDPFWAAEEEELPALKTISVQEPAHLVVCREPETGHAAAFNTGHLSSNEHTHTSAKYEKFAYSTAFAFSVPRAEWGLSQGAFDSMLALSEGDQLFRVKRTCEEAWIRDQVLYAGWKPWANVDVRTWLVAGLPWHIRIHRIHTERTLEAAEGGFALGLGDHGVGVAEGGGADVEGRRAAASTVWGASSVHGLLGYDAAELIYPQANTNLLHPRTVIPTLRARLDPGTHWLVSAVYGKPRGIRSTSSQACLVSSIKGVDSAVMAGNDPASQQRRFSLGEGADQGAGQAAAEKLGVRIGQGNIIITSLSGTPITITMD